MKNFLILGLLALLLFSVSAALSLWLNQSKQTDATAEKEKDKDKEKDKEKVGTKGGKGDPKEAVEPRPPGPKTADGSAGAADAASLNLREQDKLAQRAARVELVVRDLQTQREGTESSLRQVLTELKSASAESSKLAALEKDLQSKITVVEQGEGKTIEKIAAMYDAMTPEAAAPILKQMADSGRLEMAAKVLVKMKERNAARVMEALGDPALALQILEKMRTLRAATPPVPVAPAPGAPAKGP